MPTQSKYQTNGITLSFHRLNHVRDKNIQSYYASPGLNNDGKDSLANIIFQRVILIMHRYQSIIFQLSNINYYF